MKSITEEELVGTYDLSGLILWTHLFLEAQVYNVKQNIIYQYNKTIILLQKNGKHISSRSTRHFGIQYCFSWINANN